MIFVISERGTVNRRRSPETIAVKWHWVVVFCALSTVHCSFAAFEDTGTGARAAGLGGEYVALGDDTLSLMYNPAGLARVKKSELASEYSRLYLGLTDQSNVGQFFVGYSQPVKRWGTFALGWKQFSVDDLYKERTLSLGYGRWLSEHWAAGLALKQLYHSFGVPNIVVDDAGNVQSGTPALFANGFSQSAFSTDVGLLYRPTSRHYVGFSIQDVNQPDVALSSNDSDRVPQTIRFGYAYQKLSGLSITAGFNARKNLGSQTDYKEIGAVEKWWDTRVAGDWAARGALTWGSRNLRQLSSGFGYRLHSLQIDYAFIFNTAGITLGDTAGSQRFSLAFRFGASTPEPGKPVSVLKVSTGSIEGLMPFTLEISSPTPPVGVQNTVPPSSSETPESEQGESPRTFPTKHSGGP